MSQEVYSPKDVAITFAGAATVSGWISASVSRNSENSTGQSSADGVRTHTISADRSGTFEIELNQTNSTNFYLSAVQAAQDLDNTLYFMNITVTDKSGGFLIELKHCHLTSPAQPTLGADETSRTWTFAVDKVNYLPTPSGISSTIKAVTDANSAVETLKANSFNKK